MMRETCKMCAHGKSPKYKRDRVPETVRGEDDGGGGGRGEAGDVGLAREGVGEGLVAERARDGDDAVDAEGPPADAEDEAAARADRGRLGGVRGPVVDGDAAHGAVGRDGRDARVADVRAPAVVAEEEQRRRRRAALRLLRDDRLVRGAERGAQRDRRGRARRELRAHERRQPRDAEPRRRAPAVPVQQQEQVALGVAPKAPAHRPRVLHLLAPPRRVRHPHAEPRRGHLNPSHSVRSVSLVRSVGTVGCSLVPCCPVHHRTW